MNFPQSILLFIGRASLAVLFAFVAVLKISSWDGMMVYLNTQNALTPSLLLVLSLVVDCAGALSLFFGYRCRLGAFLLLLASLTIAVYFPDLWFGQELGAQNITMRLLQNYALAGSCLIIMAVGPGRFSFDARSRSRPLPVVHHDNDD